MVKGLARSLSRGSPVSAPIQKQVISVDGAALTVDGATGVGFGSLVLGDFPEGNILFLGAVAYMQFTGPTSGGLVDTYSGDYGVGTTPASDATISGADVDIIGSTAVGPAVAEASPITRGTGVTQAVFDNTDGSLEINLNFLVDDANISADDVVFTVTGTLYISYVILGDD